jgi:hypothetical protein
MHYVLLVCDLFSRSVRFRRSSEGALRWFPFGNLEANWDKVIPSDRLMLEKLVLCEPGKFYYRCCVRKRSKGYYVEAFE